MVAALLASCLLHITAVISPYLGGSSRESRWQQEGGWKQPRVLTATLASTTKTPTSTVSLSREGKSEPTSSGLSASPAETAQASRSRREGADLLPTPAPIYYGTDQLTTRPQPLGEVTLDTPEVRQIIATGKMILKLWINDLGEVVEVEVERNELPQAFSDAAIKAFKQLRFAAGERHGQPVGSLMRIEVSYVDGRLPPP